MYCDVIVMYQLLFEFYFIWACVQLARGGHALVLFIGTLTRRWHFVEMTLARIFIHAHFRINDSFHVDPNCTCAEKFHHINRILLSGFPINDFIFVVAFESNQEKFWPLLWPHPII